MKWRYGVIKFRHDLDKEHRFYGIGELYYESDPLKPFLCSDKPIEPFVEIDGCVGTPNEMMEQVLTMMLNDVKQYPVFDIDGPFEKEPAHGDEWVDFQDGEPFAGHVDEYALEEYYRSIQAGEDYGEF